MTRRSIFWKLLTPHQRTQVARSKAYTARLQEIDDLTLAEYAQHILNNCEGPRRFSSGETYDTILHDVVIPEMLRRLAHGNRAWRVARKAVQRDRARNGQTTSESF